MRSVKKTRSLIRLSSVVSLVVVASFAQTAEAHFMLNSPTNWWTQTTGVGGGSPQKAAPCGNEATAGTAATGIVNVFQPGQPVSVTATATIDHPGWWRISLREGASSTQMVSSFPDPTPLGAAGSAQQCTPAFIDNPVWSPTQPVLADKLGIPASTPNATNANQHSLQTTVTIPANAHCTMASPCTLQVLMIMTDHSFPTCNYHHCADMAPATGAADGGTDTRPGAGGTTGAAGASGGGQGGATGGGLGGTTGGLGGATGGGNAGATGSSVGGHTGSNSGAGGTEADSGAMSVTTNDSGGCGGCAVGSRGAAGASLAISALLIAGLFIRRRRR